MIPLDSDIYLLCDYKNHFGSKNGGFFYRGGMDVPKLIELFRKSGFNAEAVTFESLNRRTFPPERSTFLYTSSEDVGDYYKSYIEDVVFNLEQSGHRVIPKFEHLKAHNNKVAMELLRTRSKCQSIKTISSYVFGSYEEIKDCKDMFSFPAVIKSATGAMSRGVRLAGNVKELQIYAEQISKSKNIKEDLWDILRKMRHRTKYIRESTHRKKFVVQNYINGLSNDWKVLVYGKSYFILYRGNRENDFRASGSGRFEFRKEIPHGILTFAYHIKEYFNVPNISLDIGFDGTHYHLFEFQFLYFGTTTIEKSPFHFIRKGDEFQCIDEKVDLEETYEMSIVDYLNTAASI